MSSLPSDIIEEILLKLSFLELIKLVDENEELLQLPLIKQLFDPYWNPRTHLNKRLSSWIEELRNLKVNEVPITFNNVFLLKWCYLNLTQKDKIFAITQNRVLLSTIMKLFSSVPGMNFMGFKYYPNITRYNYAPYDFPAEDDNYLTFARYGFQDSSASSSGVGIVSPAKMKVMFVSADHDLFCADFDVKDDETDLSDYVNPAIKSLCKIHNYPHFREIFHPYVNRGSSKFVLSRDSTFSKLRLDYDEAKLNYKNLDRRFLTDVELATIEFFDLDTYYSENAK